MAPHPPGKELDGRAGVEDRTVESSLGCRLSSGKQERKE